ncbi:putative cell surface hydrolase [Lactiplantibacillus plantarum]|nr:putative cell surface hydrolase [Lactiplantibacillus plantarum]
MKQMKWWLLTLLLVFGLAGCTSQAKPTSTKSRQSTSQKRVSAYIDSTTRRFMSMGFKGVRNRPIR